MVGGDPPPGLMGPVGAPGGLSAPVGAPEGARRIVGAGDMVGAPPADRSGMVGAGVGGRGGPPETVGVGGPPGIGGLTGGAIGTVADGIAGGASAAFKVTRTVSFLSGTLEVCLLRGTLEVSLLTDTLEVSLLTGTLDVILEGFGDVLSGSLMCA